ncbi:MAG: carbon-nitrogen hydrolase family protein [Pirellulaceae bacterium]|nr:carbon-nitrogen hydrolase family protein [Pirellulaceae bacterium]
MGQYKVAGVQMDVAFGEKAANLQRMLDAVELSAAAGADLVVFPECALTGYCFTSADEAFPFTEPADGPSAAAFREVCRARGVHAIYGMLEKDGDRLFNAVLLIGPDGLVATYRKIHLPFLGIDRFATPGDRPFDVHPAGACRVGMHICYDGGFPESARCMALDGADLIALPTNWPPPAMRVSEYVLNTRAMENNVYYMAVDRVGVERGVEFIGRSRICAPNGSILDDAPHDQETVLYADIDVEWARRKKIVHVPGEHEVDRFGHRRPEMYGRISQPKDE